MATDLKLTTLDDLDVTGQDLGLVSAAENLEQRIRIRLRWFLGEWFLDTRLGVPFYRDVFVKAARVPVIQSLFRGVILRTPEIIAVTRLEATFDRGSRMLRIKWEATGAPGTVTGETGVG